MAGDVNHGGLKMSEGEIGVERQHVRRCAQPFLAPRGMAKPEHVPPVRRFEGDGALCGGRCLGHPPQADQGVRERGMRLRQ